MNISFLKATPNFLGDFNRFIQISQTSVAPWSRLILAVGLTSLVGLSVYSWSNRSKSSLIEEETMGKSKDFQIVKDRVMRAYAYVFAGWSLTAVAATAFHVSGLSRIILQTPLLAIPVCIVSVGSLLATILTDKENVKQKHLAWAIFNASMGLTLSPIAYLGTAVVAQAAVISLGFGALLTFVAYKAPNKEFIQWDGPLLTCLTIMNIASAVACFFPTSAFAWGVDRVSLYGGLLIFTGFLLSSTQQLLRDAEKKSEKDFDPIRASLNIYLDGLNIFIRIARILAENQEKKEQVA